MIERLVVVLVCALATTVFRPPVALAQDRDQIEAIEDQAAAGDIEALFALAERYEIGNQVAHNIDMAAALTQLAAERGHTAAQFRMGIFHFAGLGVAKDLVESYRWFLLAQSTAEPNGNVHLLVDPWLATVLPYLSPNELAEAERLVEGFSTVDGPAELPDPDRLLISMARPPLLPALSSEEVQARLPETRCGPAEIRERDDGSIDVTLFTVSGDPTGLPTAENAAFLKGNRVRIDLIELDTPLCQVLDTLYRTGESAAGSAAVILRDENGIEKTVFRDQEYLVLEFPGFDEDRYVAVDYVQRNGLVVRLYPSGDVGEQLFSAGQRQVLGDPGTSEGPTWRISPPFGKDVMIVFASRRRLSDEDRPTIDRVDSYTQFLRDTVGGASDEGDVLVDYRIVTTVQR